jgi:hypothetical protein
VNSAVRIQLAAAAVTRILLESLQRSGWILLDSHRGYRRTIIFACAAMLIVECGCSLQRPFMRAGAAEAVSQSSPDVVAVVPSTVEQSNNPNSSPITPIGASVPVCGASTDALSCEDSVCDPLPPEPTCVDYLYGSLYEFRQDVCGDYRNYYSWRTARDLLLCTGGAAIMANTTIDEKFQHWVQDDARSSESDEFADFWKCFGNGKIFIPAWAGLGVAASMLDRWPVTSNVGEFGLRTTRSYLVGIPPMYFMQYCLGGSRPEEGKGSDWQPFDDSNGVSGHAYIGAVPFITAAQMCDNRCLKGCFYFMSVLPAWSRVNDDSHYLSQVWMGWWMAYLSSRAVSETQQEKCMSVSPILAPNTIGMMLEYRR